LIKDKHSEKQLSPRKIIEFDKKTVARDWHWKKQSLPRWVRIW
jgi:hypothetical protein